jgi:hypothetical protein
MMACKNMLVEREDEQSQRRIHAVGVMKQKVGYGTSLHLFSLTFMAGGSCNLDFNGWWWVWCAGGWHAGQGAKAPMTALVKAKCQIYHQLSMMQEFGLNCLPESMCLCSAGNMLLPIVFSMFRSLFF